jgi:hypothetical protein
MSSPNLDTISISFSHLIDDPVTTATTDGQVITSAYRTKFINDGIRNCLKKWLASQNWRALRSYIKDGSASLTAGSALLSAWSGNVFEIISAKNTTDSVFVYPMDEDLKHFLELGNSQYISPSLFNQYYAIDNGYFRLLDGVGTSTDTIYLRYIKEHTDLAVGSGASTLVYDASFTYTVATLTITNFTGVISTHVGGRLVGTDAGGNLFDRGITSYISSTSFTIDSALTNAGTACTVGYITPPAQNDIEIDSQYWDEVLEEAFKIYIQRYPTEKNIARIKVAG